MKLVLHKTEGMKKGITILCCLIGMQIHAQNVGIGTINPGADLEIKGDQNSAALFWDDGKASLRHHFNALTWERSIFNMFLDANNDQNDAAFSIFTNSFTDVGLAKLRFDLEQGDSWIHTKRLAINHTNPTNALDVNGTIKIGTEDLTTPTAGTIRYENGVFEGYDGQDWLPLSSRPIWGETPITTNESFVYVDTAVTNTGLITNIELSEDFCFMRIEDANEVRVLQRTGSQWDSIQTLTSPFNDFGRMIVADGASLIIASEGTYEGIGQDTLEYFHYDGTAWTKQQEIPLSSMLLVSSSYYEQSIDLSNNRLIVGDLLSLRFYKKQNNLWSLDTIFHPSAVPIGNVLGTKVSIDQNRACATHLNISSEEDYLITFENIDSQWYVTDTIINPSTTATQPFFGSSVELSGDYLVITEQPNGFVSPLESKIHLFKYDGTNWVYRNTIQSPEILSIYFGGVLELQNTTLVVSNAPYYNVTQSLTSVDYQVNFHVYEIVADQLMLSNRLTPSQAIEQPIFGGFGLHVELSGSTIATINPTGSPAGIYFYERN